MNTVEAVDLKLEMEAFIDKYSMSNLLDLVTQICYEKADHVRSNWQDDILAKGWEQWASMLEGLSLDD